MAEALICKYTGADMLYMRDEVGVYEFVILLAVALETDEQEFFRQYTLAHGDPKKFKWTYGGSASSAKSEVLDVDKLVMQWTAGDKAGPGNRINTAKTEAVAHLGRKVFRRVYEYPNGAKKIEYVDEAGNIVDMKGSVFMKSGAH